MATLGSPAERLIACGCQGPLACPATITAWHRCYLEAAAYSRLCGRIRQVLSPLHQTWWLQAEYLTSEFHFTSTKVPGGLWWGRSELMNNRGLVNHKELHPEGWDQHQWRWRLLRFTSWGSWVKPCQMHLVWTNGNQGVVESLCQQDVTPSGFCQALPYICWSMQSLPTIVRPEWDHLRKTYKLYNQCFSGQNESTLYQAVPDPVLRSGC